MKRNFFERLLSAISILISDDFIKMHWEDGVFYGYCISKSNDTDLNNYLMKAYEQKKHYQKIVSDNSENLKELRYSAQSLFRRAKCLKIKSI